MTRLKSWTFINTVGVTWSPSSLPPPASPQEITSFFNGVCIITRQTVLVLCFQETQVLGLGRAGPAGWEGVRRRGRGSRARL